MIGSGLGRRGSRVRWGTARTILVGWVLTLPAAAVVGAIAALLAHLGTVGIVIDAVLGLAFILGIFVLSRQDRVDHASLEKEVNAAGAAVKIQKAKQGSRA